MLITICFIAILIVWMPCLNLVIGFWKRQRRERSKVSG
jgi:hypothetical protein